MVQKAEDNISTHAAEVQKWGVAALWMRSMHLTLPTLQLCVDIANLLVAQPHW